MVRAEDGSEFASVTLAQGTQCRACGAPLEFKEENGSLVAEHCDTKYTIVQSQGATISAGPVPAEGEKAKATATTTSTSGSGTTKGKK